MIVTLTANPTNDRTVALDGRLRRGEVLRVGTGIVHAGGKGVNVSRAAHAAGVPTRAVLPAADDDPYLRGLEALGIPYRNVPVAGAVRTNLTLTEPDGTTTKLNEPGPHLDDEAVRALVAAVADLGRDATWVVLAGSLPPGAPDDLYSQVTAALADAPTRVAIDTSGPPLRALVDGAVPPDLVKPNAEELAELVGGDAAAYEADHRAAARAAIDLLDVGIDSVLLTLGATGSIAITHQGVHFAPTPKVDVVSTVGAGDSSLTGWLLADLAGHDVPTRLRWATAYGATAVTLPGTQLPTPDDVDTSRVESWALDLATT